MTRPYHLTPTGPVAPQRLEDFVRGRLDLTETALLMQDVLDTGLLHSLPAPFWFAAQYCVDVGYCSVHGSYLH